MTISGLFFLNSILLGAGLAMDAFSVSVADGIRETEITVRRSLRIAGTFGAFQTGMPLLGWLCVHTIAEQFQAFQRFIPWIALILLAYLGVKMILESVKGRTEESEPLQGRTLFLEGIATSIDALSVGFTIAEYSFLPAFIEALLIGIVTLCICLAGLHLGRKIGSKISKKAEILGGIILIGIGVEIFLTGI